MILVWDANLLGYVWHRGKLRCGGDFNLEWKLLSIGVFFVLVEVIIRMFI